MNTKKNRFIICKYIVEIICRNKTEIFLNIHESFECTNFSCMRIFLLLHITVIMSVGQQEIAPTEDRNSDKSQNFLKWRTYRIILSIFVG